MNEKKLDRMLPEALTAAARLDLTAAEPQPCPASAARIYAKMLDDSWKWRRKKLRPAWQKGLQLAASFAIVCILGFSALLAVSSSANAAFTRWFEEVQDGLMVYHGLGETINSELPEYELQNLPEGAQFIEKFDGDGYISVSYQVEEEWLYFDYMVLDGGSVSSILTDGMEREEVSVNGCKGFFYSSEAPGIANEIIWIDEENNVMLSIGYCADKQEILHMAESVILEK